MAGSHNHPIPLSSSSSSSSDREEGYQVRPSMKPHQLPCQQLRSDGGGEGVAGGKHYSGVRIEERKSRSERNQPHRDKQDAGSRSGHRFCDDSRSSAPSGSVKHRAAASPIKAEPISFMPMEDQGMFSEPISTSLEKRPVTNDITNGGASTWKKAGREEEESYQGVSKLKWKETDEIALLNGILEFHSEYGVMPNVNSTSFYEIMKDRLPPGVTRIRLMKKLRRMNERHVRNMRNPKDWLSPHEFKCFKLSKKIWGNNLAGNDTTVTATCSVDEDVKGRTRDKREDKSSLKGSTPLVEQGGQDVLSEHPAPEQTRSSSPATHSILHLNHEEVPEVVVEEKVVNATDDEGQYATLYPNLMKMLHMRAGESCVDIVLKNLSLLKGSDLKKMDNEWEKHSWAEMEIYVKHTSMTLNLLKSQEN